MVEVADVGSRVRSQKTYDLAFIIQNSKIADAGGPVSYTHLTLPTT